MNTGVTDTKLYTEQELFTPSCYYYFDRANKILGCYLPFSFF